MLSGNIVADMVVVLKTMPTRQAVEALGNKIWETLKMREPKERKFVVGGLCLFLEKSC